MKGGERRLKEANSKRIARSACAVNRREYLEGRKRPTRSARGGEDRGAQQDKHACIYTHMDLNEPHCMDKHTCIYTHMDLNEPHYMHSERACPRGNNAHVFNTLTRRQIFPSPTMTLGIEPRALLVLGKCSATALCPQVSLYRFV